MNVTTFRSGSPSGADSAPQARLLLLEAEPDACEPERLAARIREVGADVTMIYNLPVHCAASLLDGCADVTGLTPIAGPDLMLGRGSAGIAVLVRQPVRRRSSVDLSIPPMAPCGAIDVSLDIDGHSLRVLAVQLSAQRDERRAQTDRLREILLLRGERPAVLMGRFSPAALALDGDGSRAPFRSVLARCVGAFHSLFRNRAHIVAFPGALLTPLPLPQEGGVSRLAVEMAVPLLPSRAILRDDGLAEVVGTASTA